jgi:hypothetical protein
MRRTTSVAEALEPIRVNREARSRRMKTTGHPFGELVVVER